MPPLPPVLERMQSLIAPWEERGDRRAVFLGCYAMMTHNMLEALAQGEFRDGEWVDRLLHRFADYYFVALEAYEREPARAPAVWRVAHGAARNPRLRGLQYLLLGVNAHINYDLVLALADLLEPEWEGLDPAHRQARYADHCRVNAVIARTVDSVQDAVIERLEPEMEFVDRLMGPLDEWLVSRLIAGWRDRVWHHALDRVTAPRAERDRLLREVETACLETARLVLLGREGNTRFG